MKMRFLLFTAMLLLGAPLGAAAADLDGAYKGIVGAQGMRLQFAREGKVYQGLFADRSGGAYVFTAEPLETGAEAVLELEGRRLFVRFTPEGLGLQMVTIPYDENGDLVVGNAQALLFIDEAIDIPPLPRRFVAPPASPGGTIDPEAFVESYAFWPADSVSYGYSMVRGRYRTLIRLHAVVQTDILWKMCQSRAAPAGLAEALRGQGVDCRGILSAVGRAMERGAPFNRFKRDVLAQKQQLTEAIRCSIDYKRNGAACRASGARVAQAAVSMETVKSVLSRY